MIRLLAVLSLIEDGCVLADVGCDHGFLSREALLSGKAKKVYAADISAPSLEKAKRALEGLNAECIVSDGLKNIPADFDCIAVCGMGGKTLLDILRPYKGEATLVLSPQSFPRLVRETLTREMGYAIEREITVCERDRYYPVMLCKKGRQALSELELEFGVGAHAPSEELIAYLRRMVERLSRHNVSGDAKTRLEAAKAILTERNEKQL